jgi:hypothetical protein
VTSAVGLALRVKRVAFHVVGCLPQTVRRPTRRARTRSRGAFRRRTRWRIVPRRVGPRDASPVEPTSRACSQKRGRYIGMGWLLWKCGSTGGCPSRLSRPRTLGRLALAPLLGLERTQRRPHRARVPRGQPQRQRDQLVVPRNRPETSRAPRGSRAPHRTERNAPTEGPARPPGPLRRNANARGPRVGRVYPPATLDEGRMEGDRFGAPGPNQVSSQRIRKAFLMRSAPGACNRTK